MRVAAPAGAAKTTAIAIAAIAVTRRTRSVVPCRALMRLSLVPRPAEFYELFTEAGANALEAAQKAETRFREFPNSTVTQADVKATEHEGDRITRDLIRLLNTQYVTPFDREDIFALATAIDDVVDHIEEATDLLELYGVDPRPASPSSRPDPHGSGRPSLRRARRAEGRIVACRTSSSS